MWTFGFPITMRSQPRYIYFALHEHNQGFSKMFGFNNYFGALTSMCPSVCPLLCDYYNNNFIVYIFFFEKWLNKVLKAKVESLPHSLL